MAVELEETIREILIPAEARKFSPEAREALEKAGYVVYELTGQSIRSLREAGRRFLSTWHQNSSEFEALNSRSSEIAINPSQLFLTNSNEKTLEEQEVMVAQFSKKLAKEISGVKAIIGEAPDYIESYFAHLDRTGEHLFGEKYGYGWARTKTPTGGFFVALVGPAAPGGGLVVGPWRHADGPGRVFAAPLVVPA